MLNPKTSFLFQHDKLSAFTLAEVLITLGIIGVVAALTIPNLMQKTNDKELVSQYLKVHNMLSNALRETEATEQMKFYKMNYDDFIPEFEDHLKIIEKNGNTVTLADGSQYTYGEYDANCTTDEICMQISLDTNGSKKKPNKAGKDWFTLLLTKNGIKALGESETCSEGWDCGAYILAHHKLWDGETADTTPAVEKTVAEKTADALSACDASSASTCKISDDLTLSKIGDYWTTPVMNKDQWGGVDPASKIPARASDNKCYVDGSWVTSTDGYCYNSYQDGAKKYCESQGLRLPTVSELQTLYSTCSTNGLGCSGWFWSSELVEGNEHYASLVAFNNGNRYDRSRGYGNLSTRAVCVGN